MAQSSRNYSLLLRGDGLFRINVSHTLREKAPTRALALRASPRTGAFRAIAETPALGAVPSTFARNTQSPTATVRALPGTGAPRAPPGPVARVAIARVVAIVALRPLCCCQLSRLIPLATPETASDGFRLCGDRPRCRGEKMGGMGSYSRLGEPNRCNGQLESLFLYRECRKVRHAFLPAPTRCIVSIP